MGGAEGLLQPADALADALGAGVIGTVGQPKREIAGAELFGYLDGVQDVGEGLLADPGGGIAERTELVLLVLKEVGVDGAGANAEAPLEFLDLGNVVDSVGQVPKDVEGERGGDAGEAVDLSRVAELLLDGGGGSGLDKLAEAGSGVGESPGGNLDLERVQRLNSQVEGSGF